MRRDTIIETAERWLLWSVYMNIAVLKNNIFYKSNGCKLSRVFEGLV